MSGLDPGFLARTFLLALRGIPVTLSLTAASLAVALPPAAAICLARIRHVKGWSTLCALYVSFIRGTPMVVQILVVYSLIPAMLHAISSALGLNWDVFGTAPFVYTVTVFGLHAAATLSEVLRSAVLGVDKAQLEAALSLGLPVWRCYAHVILPQAAVSAVPNVSNLCVTLVKETSLAFIMTVQEITAIAKIEAARGYNYIEAHLDMCLVYILLCSALQGMFLLLEHALHKKFSPHKKFLFLRKKA